MASLAVLRPAVAKLLADGRIGLPVFVRCILHIDFGPSLSDVRAEASAALAEWLGQSLSDPDTFRSHQEGWESQRYLTMEGRLALVSVAPNPDGITGVDLTILGTHGAIYHSPELPPLPQDDVPIRESHTPSVREPYGVLLVSGAQTHQEDYAQAFATDPHCRLIAVTDESDVDSRRHELNHQLARKWNVPYIPDLDQTLCRDDVQIASICAPPDRRARIAIRCAQAGKHLYLDKPLAPSLQDARAMVAAVKDFQRPVQTHMFSFLSAPWASRARRLIQSGWLGELRAIHADVFFAKGHAGTVANPGLRREEYPPQRHQLREAKRELDNIGVYPITMIPWLTGSTFASVRAATANFFFDEHVRNDVEDFGLILATLSNGTPVTIAAGRIGWSAHPAGGVHRYILVGSRRTAVIDANRPRLEIYTDAPPWTPPPPHPEDPMAFWTSTQQEMGGRAKNAWLPLESSFSDVRYFLDCLDAGRESEISIGPAAHATEVLLASYLSASRGQIVELPLGFS
jgi:predicted dehydrogenase